MAITSAAPSWRWVRSQSGGTTSQVHDFMDRTDWWSEAEQWDSSLFTPDVVVITLGANDVGTPESGIRADNLAMLDDVRAWYPDAHIVLTNGFGWDADEPANHADEVVAGYRLDGDVASGSFEQVAPFGGWGWLSHDDRGVSRTSADDALDGHAYLVLEDSAETHQPNPATGGQTVTATAWLRGAEDGDQATLTIDFRDQTMWTTPLDSTSETVDLTTSWASYSLRGAAKTRARSIGVEMRAPR